MRKVLLFALVVALAAASVGHTQGATADRFAGLLYDVDSLTLTYCTTTGPIYGPQRIKTTGASADLEPFVAASAPFLGMAVGDVLAIETPTGTVLRAITVFTSENAVTVDSTITLTGNSFTWYRNVCGTGIGAGWIAVSSAAQRVGLTVQFEQGDITSLVARWECRHANTGDIVILYPGEGADCGLGGTLSTDRCDFLAAVAGTASGSLTVVDSSPVFDACRVGLAYTVADASDVGANREKVTVSVSIR